MKGGPIGNCYEFFFVAKKTYQRQKKREKSVCVLKMLGVCCCVIPVNAYESSCSCSTDATTLTTVATTNKTQQPVTATHRHHDPNLFFNFFRNFLDLGKKNVPFLLSLLLLLCDTPLPCMGPCHAMLLFFFPFRIYRASVR